VFVELDPDRPHFRGVTAAQYYRDLYHAAADAERVAALRRGTARHPLPGETGADDALAATPLLRFDDGRAGLERIFRVFGLHPAIAQDPQRHTEWVIQWLPGPVPVYASQWVLRYLVVVNS
jgi:hypothetical protein